MKKQNKTIVLENTENLFESIINQVEQKRKSSFLDNVVNEEIGSSKEEVFTYNIDGYFRLDGVSPNGKCGSEDLEGTNFSVELSTYKTVSNSDKNIYGMVDVFSKQKNEKFWKASCEEIANYLVKEIVTLYGQNVAEVIVHLKPNQFTKVTTLWQDHMKLPENKYIATPMFAKKVQARKFVGCGR